MNSIYPDLNNNFPEQIDNIEKMVDIDSTTKSLADQYYAFVEAGNFSSANSLLENNANLKKAVFNADKFNKLRDMIISMQRYYSDDIHNYLMNIIKYRGIYSGSTKYNKYDVVMYQMIDAQTGFMCMSNSTPAGTQPTNTAYWVPFALRGEKGESGTGLAYRGAYSSTAQYVLNDCVHYNNSIWAAKKTVTGITPTEGAAWTMLMSLNAIDGGSY